MKKVEEYSAFFMNSEFYFITLVKSIPAYEKTYCFIHPRIGMCIRS